MIWAQAPMAAPPAKAERCIINIDIPSLYKDVIIAMEIVLPVIAKNVFVMISVLSKDVVA